MEMVNPHILTQMGSPLMFKSSLVAFKRFKTCRKVNFAVCEEFQKRNWASMGQMAEDCRARWLQISLRGKQLQLVICLLSAETESRHPRFKSRRLDIEMQWAKRS